MPFSKRASLLAASSLILAALAAPVAAQDLTGATVAFTQDFSGLAPTAGNDTVTIATETALYLPVNASNVDAYTKNFLGGTNVVTNNGYVFVGVTRQNFLPNGFVDKGYEAEMTFQNLTTFTNNGSIYLGSIYYQTASVSALQGTDKWYDDILSMQGADFIGGTNSRIFLDANLNATGQTACSAALRSTSPVVPDDTSGKTLPASDCLDISGGGASGRTLVNFFDVRAGDRGAYNPEGNVIVDLTGGDPDGINANAFAIDPDTPGYDPSTGGIDKGLFLYTLGYDADDQQFKLYGVEAAGAQQLPLLVHAAADLWRTASGGWFDRQADERDRESGLGGGFWGRVVSSRTDRGVANTVVAGSSVLSFDNSYEQEDSAVTFGVDLISSDGAGGAWALGGMVGYARSRVDFNTSDNAANLEGLHGGVYGAFDLGGFFLDAALNGTWLDLDSDVPAMDLQPTGTILGTNIQSVGWRAEAGWTFGRERFTIEPLVGLTYVRTTFDDLNVPADDTTRLGGEVSFEDSASMRGSFGLRFSIDDFVPLTPATRLSLTARHGKEFDGEAAASIVNLGPTAEVANTFDGQFSELSASFTAANEAETVAGYVNAAALFGDDYDSLAVSAGLRFQW